MKPIVYCLAPILILMASTIFANDSVVVSTGDTLHPTTTSVVAIKSELLSIRFSQERDIWQVDVTFVFNNTTFRTIREKVAFVNESEEAVGYDNRVRNFSLIVNGNPAQFSRSEEKTGRDGHLGKVVTEYYAFDLQFAPGDTVVHHSYELYGTIGWGPSRRGVYYILTTARNWRGPIGKFDLSIELPRNCEVVTRVPHALVPFGNYTMTKDKRDDSKKDETISFQNGGFRLSRRDYVADENIYIDITRFAPK